MRILHVISNMDPASGGPLMVATRLAAAQIGLGHEVHLLTYEDPASDEKARASLATLPHGDRLIVRRLGRPTRGEWVFSRGARRALRELLPRMDVAHVHGVWDPILKATAEEARRGEWRGGGGTPCVVAPHGMLTPWALSEKRVKKAIAFRLGWARMVHRAACVHALNAYEEEAIRRWGFKGRIEVLPNGVFLSEIDPLPVRGEFRAKFPVVGGDPFVLFLARLHPVKGLDLLVEAMARLRPGLPDLHAVIVGPDYGARASLLADIERLKLADRVHAIGPLYGRERFTAMVDCACFCLPSRHEGFSMSIAEAMACGVPVVISDECHFPEVAGAGAGIEVPLDVGRLAAGLGEMVRDPARGHDSGAVGRRLIEERYTWPRIAEKSIGIYADLVRAGR